jgi:hypothetical protein
MDDIILGVFALIGGYTVVRNVWVPLLYMFMDWPDWQEPPRWKARPSQSDSN